MKKQRPAPKGGGVTGGLGTYNATLRTHIPRATPVMGHAAPADKKKITLPKIGAFRDKEA